MTVMMHAVVVTLCTRDKASDEEYHRPLHWAAPSHIGKSLAGQTQF